MTCNPVLTRPSTFTPDRDYLWLDRQVNAVSLTKEPVHRPVRFVAYDPCPAFIIIRNGDGSRKRCLREDLYQISHSS
jgi:hypothetical protein